LFYVPVALSSFWSPRISIL